MRVCIVTPAARGSRTGNRITALRWAGQLRTLGHSVLLRESWTPEDEADLLVALHAGRSAASIEAFHRRAAEKPILLVLTGTDIFGNEFEADVIERSLVLATRVVVLNAVVLDELAPGARAKTRIIPQSASRTRRSRAGGPFDVCVVAHLREVKDPLLTAKAARLLPATSQVRVLHAGAALDETWARLAHGEAATNPRYEWLGSLRHGETLALIESCKLLVVSSINEGGPGVVPEAVAAGTAILSTAMPAAVGLLGADHPGLFPVGDAAALARLLDRAETDPAFLRELEQRGQARRHEVSAEREREQIAALLQDLVAAGR